MVSPRGLMTTQHTDRDRNVTHNSRNPFPSAADRPSVPRSRPWGEPIWINLFGRDWVVRKPTKLGVAGTALGSLGVVCIVWGSVQAFDPVRVGIVLLLVGVISIYFNKTTTLLQELRTQNLAADEIYKIGRDQGIEDAWEDGYREGVADEKRHKPQIVVPLPQCPSCGTSTALRSVASVANRG